MLHFKKKVGMAGLFLLLILCLISCSGKNKNPVTLTIWHVYGAQTDSPLNGKIDRFNETVGREKGIHVDVTFVSDTGRIHETVIASSNQEPGSSPLPDLFLSYPKTLLSMKNRDILVDYRDYFTKEELDAFIPAFLEEGQIEGELNILPIAKSTEILYINQTAFSKFSQETGVQEEDLYTWEGLFEAAKIYYDWTDAKTPAVEGDGKAFFTHDYPFNYFQVGICSLGGELFDEKGIRFDEIFETVWNPYAEAASYGGVWLEEGYATDPLRTGEVIVSVASSASVLYYSDVVTHPDNTSEKITIVSRPCPVFSAGEKLVMQRGAGICLVKSDKAREEAAILFLKWLLEPKRNTEFVCEAGYMPVTSQAFSDYLSDEIEKIEDPKYISLYEAFIETREEYEFFTPPQNGSYLEMEKTFEKKIRKELSIARDQFMQKKDRLSEITKNTLRQFRYSMEQ